MLVYFHLDDTLRLFGRQLVFLDLLQHVVDSGRTLLLRIVDRLALAKAMQAAHDGRLDQTHRSVNVVVLELWDQHLIGLLDQVILDRADVLNVLDVFIKARINRHVLGPDCEPLAMLLSAPDVQNERNQVLVLSHHLLQKGYRQVHAFNNK